jgi:hypothetical protein
MKDSPCHHASGRSVGTMQTAEQTQARALMAAGHAHISLQQRRGLQSGRSADDVRTGSLSQEHRCDSVQVLLMRTPTLCGVGSLAQYCTG